MKRLSSPEIKAIELGIMKELDRICTEHGLRYSLAYGTALGAVRHGGFIPWDDDIDVFMPRPDYERLWDLCSKQTSGTYRLISYRDKSSIYHFFKMVDTRTTSYETFVGKKYPTGLWVDIFPLEPVEGVSEKDLARARSRQRRVGLVRSFAVADATTASNRAALVAKKVVCPLAHHLNPYRLAETLDNMGLEVASKAVDQHDEGPWLDLLGSNALIDGRLIFPTQTLKFEDTTFQGPARAEDYLAQEYGDWRKTPPIEERAVHFPEAYLLDEAAHL